MLGFAVFFIFLLSIFSGPAYFIFRLFKLKPWLAFILSVAPSAPIIFIHILEQKYIISTLKSVQGAVISNIIFILTGVPLILFNFGILLLITATAQSFLSKKRHALKIILLLLSTGALAGYFIIPAIKDHDYVRALRDIISHGNLKQTFYEKFEKPNEQFKLLDNPNLTAEQLVTHFHNIPDDYVAIHSAARIAEHPHSPENLLHAIFKKYEGDYTVSGALARNPKAPLDILKALALYPQNPPKTWSPSELSLYKSNVYPSLIEHPRIISNPSLSREIIDIILTLEPIEHFTAISIARSPHVECRHLEKLTTLNQHTQKQLAVDDKFRRCKLKP